MCLFYLKCRKIQYNGNNIYVFPEMRFISDTCLNVVGIFLLTYIFYNVLMSTIRFVFLLFS